MSKPAPADKKNKIAPADINNDFLNEPVGDPNPVLAGGEGEEEEENQANKILDRS